MNAKTAVILVVGVLIVFSGVLYFALTNLQVGDNVKAVCGDGKCTSGESSATCAADCSSASVGKPYSRWDVEFDTVPITGGTNSQDSEGDIDIDIFVWNPEKNADLVKEGWIDCSGVVPAKFDGDVAKVDLKEENYCLINVYTFWRDSNFDAGSSELQIQKYLTEGASDITDVSNATGDEATLQSGKTYLVTVSEKAAADINDVVPQAFLIESSPSTTLDIEEFEAGNINTRFTTEYYSDAGNHSKVTITGECEDDEDNTVSLNSNLNGAVHSSLTTATSIKLDCDVEVSIDRDGYAMILKNPLSKITSQTSYIVVNVYGENATAGIWTWYGNSTYGFTGDIGYSAANVATSQILYEESSVCGIILSSDSSADAIEKANEKVYTNDCFDSVAEKRKGVYGIFDEDAQLVIDTHMSEINVDYDEAAAANDEIVSGAGGGTGEDLLDINLYTMDSTADKIGQTITA